MIWIGEMKLHLYKYAHNLPKMFRLFNIVRDIRAINTIGCWDTTPSYARDIARYEPKMISFRKNVKKL
jgi:hypothetical protein